MVVNDFLNLAPNPDKAKVSKLLEALLFQYNQPERHYHNLRHIEDGLYQQTKFFSSIKLEDFFAWMYHDVVYNPQSSDNEYQSAVKLMEDSKDLGLNLDQAEECFDLILSTKHTGRVNLVTDIDLSILGQEPHIYKKYAQQIRKEYAFVSKEVWKTGRTEVLANLLNRDRLYHTNEFAAAFTAQAHVNLLQEITSIITK